MKKFFSRSAAIMLAAVMTAGISGCKKTSSNSGDISENRSS